MYNNLKEIKYDKNNLPVFFYKKVITISIMSYYPARNHHVLQNIEIFTMFTKITS